MEANSIAKLKTNFSKQENFRGTGMKSHVKPKSSMIKNESIEIESNQNDVGNKANAVDEDVSVNGMHGAKEYMLQKVKLDKGNEIQAKLYDTPRFEDIVGDERISRQGYHAIGLLLPLTRLTLERQKFFTEICRAFNGELWQYVIIIFTHYQNQGKVDDIKKELMEIGNKQLIDLIANAGERCILFDRTRNEDEMVAEFKEKLMDVVDHTHYEKIYLRKESIAGQLLKMLRLKGLYQMMIGKWT